MNGRYSWKQMPEFYNASHYNNLDLKLGRRFVIIDNWTHREYDFPDYQKKDGVYVNMIANQLWNQDFFNWICSTAPDFCINIPKEFLKQPLIDICIDNTSKAEFGNEVPNMTLEQSIRFVRRMPEAIYCIKVGYISEDMLREVLEKKPELLIEINENYKYNEVRKLIKELIDKETLKKHYEGLTVENRVRLIKRGSIITDILTTEIIEELLNGGHMRFSDKAMLSNEVLTDAIPIEIVSKNIADKMFKASSSSLVCIPDEFITYEMCEKAVTDDKSMIRYVPKKFQLPNLHKIVIDANPKNISLINEETLTDEVIKYAISKNGIILGNIPEPRRTREICEIAVENNSNALKFVPKKYKTYTMCKKAIMFNTKVIKFVPVEIMTPEFIEEIKAMNLNIGSKELIYMQECLKTHEKLTGAPIESKDFSKKENENSQMIDNDALKDFNNISLNNLSMYFSNPVLQLFEKLNIKKLGELFAEYENSNFLTYLKNPSIYQEVMGTIKLLKCKYLNQDPLIDIYDEEMPITEIAQNLGLSTRSYNAIVRGRGCGYSPESIIIPNDITAKQFYEKMRMPNIREELMKIRNLGENSIIEILVKVRIVIDYYDNLKKKSEESTLDDTLESLNSELQRLREERSKIDAQIDAVIAKIQEKIFDQSKPKGGVSK